MTDRNHNPNQLPVDRELGDALAKYVTADPRPGLEDRILANLRAEQHRAATKVWWRWPAIATLVALVVTLFLTWKSEKPMQKIRTQLSHTTTQPNMQPAIAEPHHPGLKKRIHSKAVSLASVAVVPKLDRFPSPQPLSSEETILARYVSNFPDHAALIARARTEELQRDAIEEMDDAGSAGK